jgi:hypothetical protein
MAVEFGAATTQSECVRPAWERAIDHVHGLAHGPVLDRTLEVTIHFHPDRRAGATFLLEHLIQDGIYRSQFETGTSNGGLTAYPGGERWRWEQRIFGGVYDTVAADERPKYGSLNYRRHPAGGSVRFGSSYFRLAEHALDRTTFCYPDSATDPSHFGSARRMALVELAQSGDLDVLDDHIEAHVHGTLRLDRDVDLLVLDPSFQGTEVERAARRLPFACAWHHGFRLHVEELALHEDFRGADVVAAGVAVAEAGWLDARIVGRAVQAGRFDAQTLKRVWHCVARFGHRWPSDGRFSP